jgi:hypothetical protein
VRYIFSLHCQNLRFRHLNSSQYVTGYKPPSTMDKQDLRNSRNKKSRNRAKYFFASDSHFHIVFLNLQCFVFFLRFLSIHSPIKQSRKERSQIPQERAEGKAESHNCIIQQPGITDSSLQASGNGAHHQFGCFEADGFPGGSTQPILERSSEYLSRRYD